MLNCAVIMGRLVADPELRTTGSGISVTSDVYKRQPCMSRWSTLGSGRIQKTAPNVCD